ncbi:hypothetical protein BRADI_5g21766v3 [Brachypodium distachyon]|uniref:Uncharacterized protein n=1 Tax=Brachypodium distachyon TaxID=15368 RepID=A0A2K2CIJ1_BRADI|nr:hypothetical protein BRADI_5g21766v3 [Brachypodium distachyon]
MQRTCSCISAAKEVSSGTKAGICCNSSVFFFLNHYHNDDKVSSPCKL